MKERTSVVVEEYLQAILALQAEEGPLKAVNLTRWLKSSPSTVHATLSRLQRDKLVKVTDKKVIQLTKKGQEKAESLARRHRLVEWFLCDKLCISWHEVHKHAHVLEHGLTPLVEDKLAEFLGFPKSCPHGTPLPGEDGFLPKNTKSLDSFVVGDEIEIVNIGEILEESIDLMKFFLDKGIKPGVRHEILEKTDITKTIIMKSDLGSATLTYEIAAKIGAIKY
jgi:DtxR family transcriptional regulator, iron-dependent repressor